MNEQRILEELLDLLRKGGVQIREEPLGGSGGGFCIVQGRHVFFVDTQSPSALSIQMCIDAVTELVDTEQVYITPQVRQLLENNQKEKME